VEKEQPQRELRRRYEGWGEVHSTRTNIFAAGGFTELSGEGSPCESCETVAQRRSGVGGIEQFDIGEGWVLAVCDFLPGQQMWRVREGSGEAGEAPACTTTAARGRMPMRCRWLVDGPSQQRDDQDHSEGASGHNG
jgi:hypothetical protein